MQRNETCRWLSEILLLEAEIKKILLQQEEYNTLISTLEGKATILREALKALGKYSRIVLSEVGSKFGYDSVEYEKAGGTRTSAIKRNRKSTKKTA